MIVAPTKRALAIKTRLFLFINSSPSNIEFFDFILRLFWLSFDTPEAQTFIGSARVPRDWRLLWYGTGRRQRKHQRLCRVMRNVARHVVVFLVNVAVEHGYILVRH